MLSPELSSESPATETKHGVDKGLAVTRGLSSYSGGFDDSSALGGLDLPSSGAAATRGGSCLN